MKNKKLKQIITPDTANNQTEITIEKYAQEEKASKPHRLVLSFLKGQLPRIWRIFNKGQNVTKILPDFILTLVLVKMRYITSFSFNNTTKGQIKSEWIYEITNFPKY